jgi:hypothetical protein
MDFRNDIRTFIAAAIDGTTNYSGENYEQNKNNWLEISTDRIIGIYVKLLNQPVDIDQKYETSGQGGIWLNLDDNVPENEKHNQEQLVHLAKYADDRGYNRYHDEMVDKLMRPYTPLQNEGMFANISNEGDINGKTR